MQNSILFLGTSHGDPTLTRFCSSALYRFNDTAILIDAGEPVTALLVRSGFKSSMLDALLLTHMHTDHAGGLSALITSITKYPTEGHKTDFYFPDPDALEPCRNWMEYMGAFQRPDIIKFHAAEAQKIININNVKVTPIANDHMQRVNRPSYCYLFETDNCRVLHTGDLAADFHDFPELTTPVDICVCEATHIHNRLDKFIADIKDAPIKKLIFNHIGPLWTDGNEYILENAVKSLPFPVIVAHDGTKVDF